MSVGGGNEPRPAGRTVLVTGAGRGLGLALAHRFATLGLHVIATCRDVEKSAKLLPQGVEVVALDLAEPASIDRLAGELQGRVIDYVVNNAAVRGNTEGLAALSRDDFLEVMSINALAPLLIVRAFLPHLRLGQRRVVANISSRVGSMTEGYDSDGDYAYRCSKAALNMATVKLAKDYHDEGLTVLALHPGWVKTDMGGNDAEVSPEESAVGLVKLILSAEQDCSGSFRNYDGTSISW